MHWKQQQRRMSGKTAGCARDPRSHNRSNLCFGFQSDVKAQSRIKVLTAKPPPAVAGLQAAIPAVICALGAVVVSSRSIKKARKRRTHESKRKQLHHEYNSPGVAPTIADQNRILHVAIDVIRIFAVVSVQAAGPRAAVARGRAAVAAVVVALFGVIQVRIARIGPD
jgi:hypothetical protein